MDGEVLEVAVGRRVPSSGGRSTDEIPKIPEAGVLLVLCVNV